MLVGKSLENDFLPSRKGAPVKRLSRTGDGAECRAAVYQEERLRFNARAVRMFWPEVAAGGRTALAAWGDEARGRLYLRPAADGNVLASNGRDGSATMSCRSGIEWLRARGDDRRSFPANWDGAEGAVYLEAER